MEKVHRMKNKPITVEENKAKKIDFELKLEDEKYLTSEIFNPGNKHNIEVFYNREGQPKIRVGPYAGIIQLTNKRIHFSTKVDARLFFMLSYLKTEKAFLYDPNTPIEIREGSNFFDIIGRLFLNHLQDLIKRGLLRKYVRKKENIRFLKGKLLIRDHVKKNLVDRSRFFCEYEDLTFDNLENRIILSALNSLISLIRFNEKIKVELMKFETILKDHVTLLQVNPQECNLVKYNRINQHYVDIIKLSRLILEERFIRSIHKGESRGFNFIVDMNKVFEDFITEIIEEIMEEDLFSDYNVEKQLRFNSLVKERVLITKPDIIIKKGRKEYPLIIDTKYKRKSSNSDYYQVIAYSLALTSSKACCLIYPNSDKSEVKEQQLTLIRNITTTTSDEVKLIVKKVDLSVSSTEELKFETYIKRVKDQVKLILQSFTENFVD